MPTSPSDPEPAASTPPGAGWGGAALSAELAGLFPPGVVAAELRGPGDAALLLAEEAVSVERAVPKRVGEFAAGRLCARRALAEFGVRGFALCAAPDRRPLWPEPLVGSISHTAGLGAAAVAERRRFAALGIDVEAAAAVERELWRHIGTPAEIAWLESLPAVEQPFAATLVFSAKEAFYKCWYPLTHRRLGFRDVMVSVAPDARGSIAGTGAVAVAPARELALAGGPGIDWRGRYRQDRSWVRVGFCAPASGAPPAPHGALSTPCRPGKS